MREIREELASVMRAMRCYLQYRLTNRDPRIGFTEMRFKKCRKR
jgi:hypothetical protein